MTDAPDLSATVSRRHGQNYALWEAVSGLKRRIIVMFLLLGNMRIVSANSLEALQVSLPTVRTVGFSFPT